MSDTEKLAEQPQTEAVIENSSEPQTDAAVATLQRDRLETRRWWMGLVLQPLLLFSAGTILIVLLGVAQRAGFISAVGDSQGHVSTGTQAALRYICPMMCTPPQSEPGRCPVCAMELVVATSGGGETDPRSVQIDPAARRVANIRTAPVQAMPMTRTIRAVGELSYDEGTLKTLSAYVDGRLDRLFADYTGVVVEKGDHLALVYSPRLYSGQVELLSAKKADDNKRSAARSRLLQSNHSLYESAKQRLIELGMTSPQISQLELTGEATSRMHLCAPISGTVIEKYAVEGQYVREGQAIYKLADLSKVWLMLELFPEDAATIRYGQKVQSRIQSRPGRMFTGRVAFIDPTVDPKTRTVGVRVVISNPDGVLRVGDYAKAEIEVPVTNTLADQSVIYDPELANKWISPRHPHVIESKPGGCPICGVDLVPAAQFGFVAEPPPSGEALVVPRDAVLMAGGNSVVYVETDPGRFEIRRVALGPSGGNRIVILSGLTEGEQVATRGNFLIDSQMQLAGNPSLIDPTKADPSMAEASTKELIAALSTLSDDDKRLAEEQQICPVTKMPLGSMGTPPKLDLNGQTVFICCQGCEGPLLKDTEKYLANLTNDSHPDDEATREIEAALSLLSPTDRALAERQRVCPVAEFALGSMGTPRKVDVNGTPVFICCEGCRGSLLNDPAKYLAKLTTDAPGDSQDTPAMDLPPIGVPQAIEPANGLPPITAPQATIKHSAEADTATDGDVGPVAEIPMEGIR